MFISRSSPVLGPPSGTLAAERLTSEAPSVPLAVIFLSLVSTDWLLAFDAILFLPSCLFSTTDSKDGGELCTWLMASS